MLQATGVNCALWKDIVLAGNSFCRQELSDPLKQGYQATGQHTVTFFSKNAFKVIDKPLHSSVRNSVWADSSSTAEVCIVRMYSKLLAQLSYARFKEARTTLQRLEVEQVGGHTSNVTLPSTRQTTSTGPSQSGCLRPDVPKPSNSVIDCAPTFCHVARSVSLCDNVLLLRRSVLCRCVSCR